MSDLTPVFHGEVMLAGWSESHNGGAKVTFWLSDPSELDAFRAMTVAKGKTAGQRLGCALVEIGDDDKPVQPAKPVQPEPESFGHYYQALHKTGWFYSPRVIAAAGTDAAFLNFIRQQRCVYCGSDQNPDNPVEAAHVRRVANGAGMGIKPEYSAIPLCHVHHALQHSQGESALGDSDWYDRQLAETKKAFVQRELRAIFKVESMREVPPANFANWAEAVGIADTLPAALRGHA
jgi:hypothetical protein